MRSSSLYAGITTERKDDGKSPAILPLRPRWSTAWSWSGCSVRNLLNRDYPAVSLGLQLCGHLGDLLQCGEAVARSGRDDKKVRQLSARRDHHLSAVIEASGTATIEAKSLFDSAGDHGAAEFAESYGFARGDQN